MEEATGAAADRPVSAMVIQMIAQSGSVVVTAPNTAVPASMPATSTVLRTFVSS